AGPRPVTRPSRPSRRKRRRSVNEPRQHRALHRRELQAHADGVGRPRGCHHDPMMQLVSIQVGRPRTISPTGDGELWDREWETAYWKDPVEGPVMLGSLNVEGDGQADTNGHGGPDQAALCYSADH